MKVVVYKNVKGHCVNALEVVIYKKVQEHCVCVRDVFYIKTRTDTVLVSGMF